MPNDSDALASAKAALAHAKATFPTTNSPHDVGAQFAAQHNADSTGAVKTPVIAPVIDDKQAINDRIKTMHDLMGSNTSFMNK